MPKFITKLILTLIVSCIVSLQPAVAVKIVRMELEYGSDTFIATGGFDIPKTNRTLDLELFDDVTPGTVTNYLNYVNSGLYDLTFFNRSLPGFIIQTGGFTNTLSDTDALGTKLFTPVPEFDPVGNEAGPSNIRGTIAMATVPADFIEGGDCEVESINCTLKDGTGPDSANSEWFINLNDNSFSLDTTNGGFTVFGSVVDDGMEVADQIASFPPLDISFIFGSSFANIPIADDNRSAGKTLYTKNLVMVKSVTEISRPILRFTPAEGDFDFTSAISEPIDVVLKNTGNEAMNIGLANVAAINTPFSIQSEDCFNTQLEPFADTGAFCTLRMQHQPTASGTYSDILRIDYTSQVSGDAFSVKYHGPPNIEVVDVFDVGVSQVDGFSSTKNISVSNNGQIALQIAAITISSATNFSQTNDCVANNPLIAPGATCTISVNFTTNDYSVKSATLSIDSNDPVNGVFDIILSGYGDSDADGVLSAIEDAAPNVGDNNFDGILDSKQNNIASPVSTLGDYISLVVGNNHVVSNISMTSADQLSDLPSDVEFKYGDIAFQIDIDEPGAVIEVGLILPAAATRLTGYYFFGETDDNITPHWYPYENVQIIVNGALGGSQHTRDFIKLLVKDGGLGDADQTVNGRILLAHGAPAYSANASSDSSGSSSMNSVFLGIFVALLLLVKRRRLAD